MDKTKNKSIKAKIALVLAVLVMSVFLVVKTMVFTDYIPSNPTTRVIEFGCFLLFIPIFGVFAKEFLKKGKEDAKQGIYLKKLNNVLIEQSHNHLFYEGDVTNGAKALVKGASTALAASDLTVGKIYQGVYDGTRIQVTELAASTASEWTTATVAISSAEILTIGSVGKTLLAAPGAGTYYEIESVRLEYDHNTTAYTIVGDALFLGYYSGNYPGILINTQLISTAFDGAFVWRGDVVQNVQAIGGTDYTTANAQRMNEALVLQMFNATDPTLGNGTMRALIRYKIRTFGA